MGSEEKAKPTLEEAARQYLELGGEERLDALAEAGRGLVHHFARLYSGSHPSEDIIQAGFEGLLKAACRFRQEKGCTFATYAGHCIMGEIRHFIRKENDYYRPGCIADLQRRVEKVIEDGLKKTGEAPSVEEIADVLSIRKEGVVQILMAGLVSLDRVDLSKISSRNYESFRLPIEDRITLEQALYKLTSLQKKLVYLLFYRDLTQAETAAELGMTQRKVSRLQCRTLKKLGDLLVDFNSN